MSFTDIMAKKMQKALEKNLNQKTLTPENMESFLKDLRIIFLESDVNFRVIKDLMNKIREKAKGEYINDGLDHNQALLKIVHDELVQIMGKPSELVFDKKPTVIMIVGLQGSGKTTTIAKLANLISNKYKKRILLVACDTYRLAAVDQLKILAQSLNLDIYTQENQNPVIIAQNGKKYAEDNNFDVVLIDTAGRLHIDDVLMQELKVMQKTIYPEETLIVIDGMVGQDMINTIKSFQEQIRIEGCVLTKMDGSARGGIALSLSHLTNIPIKFLGIGEKTEDIEVFYPKRMADRILGMGDIDTLIEKASANLSNRDIEATMDRMMVGQFDLDDLLNQMKQVKKMGKMSSLVKMIPGLNGKISDEKMAEAEADLRVSEIIINSTTLQERQKPQLLRYPTRKKRILKGSGRNEKELNKLLGQYEKTKKMMDQVSTQVKNGEMPDLPGIGNIFNNNQKN